jgi:NAD-dependent dihydropyrimidine dehydrogenase PreA subunit
MGKQYRTFEVYLVHVEAEKCDGCEECVKYCPVDVFDMTHKAVVARQENCLGCGTCAAVCKSKAIIITEL